MSFGWLIISNN